MSTKQLLGPGTSHFITLAEAREMKSLYGSEKDVILAPEYRNKNILSVCETFNRDAFDALLSEEGCVGIRVYFGMGPDLQIKLIAVGVDQNNSDILPAETVISAAALDGGKIVEAGQHCPPFCPTPPAL